jgi:hypothetical protein
MDNSGNQALRDLGIFYCSAYVVSLTACALAWWLYWDAWRLDSLLPDLAIITTVSAGVALLATILKEAVWNMVLAGMKIRQWREEGRKQGVEQGVELERERRRKRDEEARAKFGIEVDGVLVLPQTPEVDRFLAGEDEPGPEQ